MSNQIVYNVLTDLRSHGYNIIEDVNSPKSTTATTTRATSHSPSTLQPTLEETQSSSESRLPEENNSPSTQGVKEESSSREVESRSKYYPGETTQGESSTQSRSQGDYREPTREPGFTKEDVVEIVGKTVSEAVGEAMTRGASW